MEYVGLFAANAFMLWALLYAGLFMHEMGHAIVESQYSHVLKVDVVVGHKAFAKHFFNFWKWRFFFGHGMAGIAIRYSDKSKRFMLPRNVRVWQAMIASAAGPAASLITVLGYLWVASIVSVFFMLPFLLSAGIHLYGGVYVSLFSGKPGTDGHTISKGIKALRSV